MKKSLIIMLFSIAVHGQDTLDTITEHRKFDYRQLVVPATLVGYGIIGIESEQIKQFNTQIRQEVQEDIDEKTTIDDFSQYSPAAAVYALNAFGIKGKHRFRDRTIIMATSYLIMSGTVLALKLATKIERPDGTSFNSFPSGHTATAFAGAEFLWQEYQDESIWYGIGGYLVATGTGLFRMYNNRHWLTDVAAGAGIGILSTKIAYWIYPWVNKTVFGGEPKVAASLAPFYNGKQTGIGIAVTF